MRIADCGLRKTEGSEQLTAVRIKKDSSTRQWEQELRTGRSFYDLNGLNGFNDFNGFNVILYNAHCLLLTAYLLL